MFFEGVVLASIPEDVLALHGDVKDNEATCSWSEVNPALCVLILAEDELGIL